MIVADLDYTASSTTCGFDYAFQHDYARQPFSLSIGHDRRVIPLRDDFSGAMYVSELHQPAEILFPSTELGKATSRQITNLARPQPAEDDEYVPPPARPETVNEAKWIAMQISHLPKPSIQLLDAGEIVFSWVRKDLIADFQFDGSGSFCAYVGKRPNMPLLRERFGITSPEVKTRLIALLKRALDDSREKT